MAPIIIKRRGKILAHHTTETHLSHYGQPAWIVEVSDPKPGPAIWEQDGNKQEINILGVKSGWLIARQPGGLLVGIMWSDGNYYANLIENAKTGRPCRKLTQKGQKVRGTVQFDPQDMGAIIL